MKVICAPDSFKESLTAGRAAEAMARGVRRARPDAAIDLCPISDGGEGFADALRAACGGAVKVTKVHGPLCASRDARWVSLPPGPARPRTAAIEMAAASGLELVPESKRDPTRTTTYGTGELIDAAAGVFGHTRVLVGIGGSATCDGGCGMAQALGVRFFNPRGHLIEQPITGGTLADIARIDASTLKAAARDATVIVACDVTNPLTGPNGAAHVYGPQKGATPRQVKELDGNLKHLAELFRQQLGRDVQMMPGAGAAGGLGAGLVAFLGAELRPGVELVLDAVRFDQRVADCDLCLTGEGKLDGQSLSGKACLGVAKAASRAGVKTVALVGALGADPQRTLAAGLWAYHVIGEGLPREESMRRAFELLEAAAARVTAEAWG